MRILGLVFSVLFLTARAGISAENKSASPPEWSLNASIIEACSCPMFCQCYFNTSPAGHHEHGGGGELRRR